MDRAALSRLPVPTNRGTAMIDVILPVLDEADAIPWVLARMPDGYRPIIVDNGSTDGSPDIARALGARVISEPEQGFGTACYAGLLSSTTPLVCFMDCDASLDPPAPPTVVALGEVGP